MTERPRSKRWTREEWEHLLKEERRSEAARPPVVSLGARVQVELVDERGGVEALDLVPVPDANADPAREGQSGGRRSCAGKRRDLGPRCAPPALMPATLLLHSVGFGGIMRAAPWRVASWAEVSG